MAGYHNRPEVTAEVLVDCWPHTGDIGTLDEDGYRSIVDRMKDMLIYKGYNVYPRELEELLAAQPGVLAAAVTGRPYKRLREVVIVDQIPVSAAGKTLERELRERFRGRGSA